MSEDGEAKSPTLDKKKTKSAAAPKPDEKPYRGYNSESYCKSHRDTLDKPWP